LSSGLFQLLNRLNKGVRPSTPTFPLSFQPVPNLSLQNEATFASLTSGSLTVRVDKGRDWRVDYLDGSRLLTQSGWRGMGYVDTEDGRFTVHGI
jgi:alpha-D-xyloside xylohydrolase